MNSARSVRKSINSIGHLKSAHLLQLGNQNPTSLLLLPLLALISPWPPDQLHIHKRTPWWSECSADGQRLPPSLLVKLVLPTLTHSTTSPQFLLLDVYKHRPQESTWWAKTSTGQREREGQAVFFDCSSWSQSRSGRASFKAACLFVTFDICILVGFTALSLVRKFPGTTSQWGLKRHGRLERPSLSLILDSHVHGDPSGSINLPQNMAPCLLPLLTLYKRRAKHKARFSQTCILGILQGLQRAGLCTCIDSCAVKGWTWMCVCFISLSVDNWVETASAT